MIVSKECREGVMFDTKTEEIFIMSTLIHY